MSVIRTLSASESNEQRDREKAKLEKEYKRSDQKLDELVSLHDQDLTHVMQVGIWGTLKSIHVVLEPTRPVSPAKLSLEVGCDHFLLSSFYIIVHNHLIITYTHSLTTVTG
jgi:hypothetical protein